QLFETLPLVLVRGDERINIHVGTDGNGACLPTGSTVVT
ncbi:MAG: hypothetical protein ACI8RC_003238, partial [Ilumatobacter sp.]